MSDMEDYEPAIEPDSNSAAASVESVPVGRQIASAGAAAAAEAEAQTKIGEPPGEDDGAAGPQAGPRAPRVWNSKSRALFRAAVKGAEGVAIGDDLQPMDHKVAAKPAPAPAAAAPAAQAAPPAAPAPAVATPAADAPVTPPPGLPELPELPLPADAPAAAAPATPDPKHAEREAAIAAREAALTEREKLLPDRRGMIEAPGRTTIAWLKDVYGVSDDADLKTAVADLITDLSIEGLKIGVPDEHVNGMNSRKATRVVKVYTSEVDKRERALKEREAESEKKTAADRAKQTAAQQESAYVAKLGELIAPAAAQHKFLHDREVTGGLEPAAVVYEVLKEMKVRGQKPDLAVATKFADDFYRNRATEEAKRLAHLQTLLSPASPAKPAAKPAVTASAASASPGGAPGPAPTPAAKPEPERTRDPSDLPDRRAARAATFAKIKARAAQDSTT